jgi:hypothetical protein
MDKLQELVYKINHIVGFHPFDRAKTRIGPLDWPYIDISIPFPCFSAEQVMAIKEEIYNYVGPNAKMLITPYSEGMVININVSSIVERDR